MRSLWRTRGIVAGRVFCLLIAGLAIIPLTWAASADDEWTGTDKVKHFAVSFALSTLAYNFYLKNTEWSENSSKAAAFVSTMAVGVAKEFIDDEFSWKDLGADAAGAGLGVAVSIEF